MRLTESLTTPKTSEYLSRGEDAIMARWKGMSLHRRQALPGLFVVRQQGRDTGGIAETRIAPAAVALTALVRKKLLEHKNFGSFARRYWGKGFPVRLIQRRSPAPSGCRH
jgi:hypothetical protein